MSYDEYDDYDEYGEEDSFEEYIEIIKEHSEYLESDITDIDLLAELELEDFTNSNYIYRITPMLNEIVDCANIYNVIGMDYALNSIFASSDKEVMYNDIADLTEACLYLVETLYEEGCTHPSILKYGYLNDIIDDYEEMMQNLHILKYLNNPLINNSILEMYAFIYSDTLLDVDSFGKDMLITADRIEHPIILMRYLKAAAKCQFQKKALLLDRDTISSSYYDDNSDGKFTKYVFRVNGNTKELTLSSTITLLDRINNNNNLGVELETYINMLLADYWDYKDSQYNYLKQSSEEAKVLSLCQ